MSEISKHREPVTHYLKIYPEYFSAVCTGVKRAELRKNDRDYLVGDTLHLLETRRGSCATTGEYVNAIITHIADVSEWVPGYVLLSIELEGAALRERAEPVAWRNDEGPFAVTRFKSVAETWMAKGWKITPLYTAPPAPVVPDALEQFAEFMAAESIKAGDYPDGWKCKAANAALEYAQACRAAMSAAPGKQPLSVDVLAGALRNAPLAPSDNQGRQREPASPQGWKLVPEEPTQEMIQAAMDCEVMSMDTVERDTYKAMLAAAPGKEG
ncbi:DUF3850 domain-containing protein [Cronobacter universalis]